MDEQCTKSKLVGINRFAYSCACQRSSCVNTVKLPAKVTFLRIKTIKLALNWGSLTLKSWLYVTLGSLMLCISIFLVFVDIKTTDFSLFHRYSSKTAILSPFASILSFPSSLLPFFFNFCKDRISVHFIITELVHLSP